MMEHSERIQQLQVTSNIGHHLNVDIQGIEGEVWKPLRYYGDGYILVSNKGRVKTLSRTFQAKNNRIYYVKEKIYKQFVLKYYNAYTNDYIHEVRVTLSYQGKSKQFIVSRLVYDTFKEEIDYNKDHKIIMHINGCTFDNSVENLALGNLSNKIIKSLALGRRKHIFEFPKQNLDYKSSANKLTQYDAEGNKLAVFDDIHKALKNVAITAGSIYRAAKQTNNQYKAGGYFWLFGVGPDMYPHLNQYLELLSNTRQRRAKKVIQICPETKKTIREFKNLSEAFEVTGVHKTSISNACLGKQEKAGGCMWSYVKAT